jgi:hypothetical protein
MQPGDHNGFDEGVLHQTLLVTGDLPEPGQRPLNRRSLHHSRAEEAIAYSTMMNYCGEIEISPGNITPCHMPLPFTSTIQTKLF